MKRAKTLIGPFSQVLTMEELSLKGPLSDGQLPVIEEGGILVEQGKIAATGLFNDLRKQHPDADVQYVEQPMVLIPGFIDCHTHICFGGSRQRDYAMRVGGKSYLEIAKAGGGIWDSVSQTRAASLETLTQLTKERADALLQQGVTTIEVKSGYGLGMEHELKMLRAIKSARTETRADLVATCLAAHIKPKDFDGDEQAYLRWIAEELLPTVRQEELADRVDIFVEESAFSLENSRVFLKTIQESGWQFTVHADQFTSGAAILAAEMGAVSADHLESSDMESIKALAASDTVAVALPGASLGLGMRFTPARALLDAGASLAIATDWNPGSAPMGQLLTQAAILGTFEKLTLTETLSALTFRAAHALRLRESQGRLIPGALADMQAYQTSDFREIFYWQGSLKPQKIWKSGILI